jgi:hypothetical protein
MAPIAMSESRTRNEIDLYLIWSHEHRAWWKGPSGYTPHLSEALQVDRARALQICRHAMPGTAARMSALPELPVRLFDVLAFTAAYRAEHPDWPVEDWE